MTVHKLALVSSDGASPVSQGAYSDDALTYTKATSTVHRANGDAIVWSRMAYAPSLGVIIAGANDLPGATLELMRSTDGGDNWSAVTMPLDNNWRGVAWSAALGIFVAVSSQGNVATSPDGSTWTQRTAASASAWQAVAWSPDLSLFLAVGNSTNTMTSPDGVTWTGHAAAIGSGSWTDLVWCSGSVQKFLAVGAGTNVVATWDGSAAWTNFTTFAGSSTDRSACAWSTDLGAAVITRNNAGDITLTSNLSTGTIATGQGATKFSGAAWSHDLQLFVVVGANVVYSSPDGSTWTSRTPPSSQTWISVVATDAAVVSPPVRDGFANSGNSFHSSSSGSVTLTTTNAGDAIILLIVTESAAATVSSISSTNTTGWTRRGAQNNYGSGRNVNMEVWYGFASAALTSEVITVNMSAGIDSGSIEAFGVHSATGSYTSNPFDSNVSLPGFASHQDLSTFVSTTPTVTGLTTTNANPLVLGFYGSTAGSTATAGTGFTLDDTNTSGFGTHNALSGFEHKAPGSALSGASETFGNSTFDWGMIADAIIHPGVSETGTLAVTEATDTASLAGAVTDDGIWASTEAHDAASFAGHIMPRGPWASTGTPDTLHFSGSDVGDKTGTWASTETTDICFMAEPPSGGLLATENADSFAASGAGTHITARRILIIC